MNKNAKQPSNVKKEHDADKHVQGGGQTGTVRPAEKIADDEVENREDKRQARNTSTPKGLVPGR